jgi:hypothetical protein
MENERFEKIIEYWEVSRGKLEEIMEMFEWLRTKLKAL